MASCLPLEDDWEKGVSELREARGRGAVLGPEVGALRLLSRKIRAAHPTNAHSCVVCKMGSRQEDCLGLGRPLRENAL